MNLRPKSEGDIEELAPPFEIHRDRPASKRSKGTASTSSADHRLPDNASASSGMEGEET